MPKPNYSFAKRQRELEKERKKAEKARKKSAPPLPPSENAAVQPASEAEQSLGSS